ncbi:MAG: hypothetical protein ACOC25_01675 [Alkalispirochaetaceae bacterium]
MKLRTLLLLLPFLLLVFFGCATVEEPPPAGDSAEETAEPPAQTAEPEPEEPRRREEPEITVEERPAIETLLPEGMRFVTEEGAPAIRRGDFDSDGRVDEAYLAVTGTPVAVETLAAEERLYSEEETTLRDSRLLLRLASGQDLLLNPGRFLLLAEFSSLPISSGEPTGRGDSTPSGERDSSEALLYLRFEERERQRHLLFSVNPRFKTPHRYLFLTDSATGFFVRDVDGDGRREVVHIESTVSAEGLEESYYTLYQFRRRELERRARVPMVERTNDLLQELRELLMAGERELLLRRYTGGGDLEQYFDPREARPISELTDVEFVYVPELRSNPFNLSRENPELRTEILILAQGGEELYGVRIGLVVEPEAGPRLRLLPP